METMIEPDEKKVRLEEISSPKEEQVKSANQLVTGDNLGSNPFENPAVLTRFFELCDKSDLPTFRLVSKEWHKVSMNRFRKEMQVKIRLRTGDMRSSSMKKSKSKRLDWRQTGQLEELPVGDERNPFRSFRLFDLSFIKLDPNPTYQLNMNLFWVKFGKWIHKLELVSTDVYCVNSFKKAITEDSPNLQVLKLITVELKGNYPEEGESKGFVETTKKQLNLKSFSIEENLPMPISWNYIFSHFPNIQKFELNRLESDDDDGLIPLVDTLEQVTFRNLAITDLTLGITEMDDVGNGAERFLKLPQFKLSSLCLLLKGDDRLMRHAVAASQLHAATLKKLRVFRWRHIRRGGRNKGVEQAGVDLQFHLKSFPCLTELQLDGGVCRNFHFLEVTPNLKILKMGRCFERILEETDMPRMVNSVLVHLQEFHLKTVEISESAMDMFVKVMPNLERLHACFGEESLRVAFSNWTNLRDLEIEAKIGDEVITGIEPGSETRHPHITNMKYLHQLKLTDVNRITDISVWEGFLKLPHLHTLSVTLSKETSDEAFHALVERFPMDEIKRLPIPAFTSHHELFFPYHHSTTSNYQP